MAKYDLEHFKEKQKVITERGYECQATGATEKIECHHVVPRYLGGYDGADNYQLLQSEVHRNLHEVTGSEHKQLVQKRKHAQKKLHRHPGNEKAYEHMVDLDKILIEEYVTKLIQDLPEHVRETIIQQTMVLNFMAIRDLVITIKQLRLEITHLQKNNEHENI